MRKLIISFITALSMAALPAYADRGHGRGDYGHRDYGHHGGGSAWAGVAVIGALTGLAIMAERSRPVYVAPSYAEPVYHAPMSYRVRPVAQNVWYYCQSSTMYYPNTNACPEGWQAVPARAY